MHKLHSVLPAHFREVQIACQKSLSQSIPKNDIHRYTLRMAKEGSRIEYRGDWAQAERTIMESNGYKNGDDLSGKMFPTLYQEV